MTYYELVLALMAANNFIYLAPAIVFMWAMYYMILFHRDKFNNLPIQIDILLTYYPLLSAVLIGIMWPFLLFIGPFIKKE